MLFPSFNQSSEPQHETDTNEVPLFFKSPVEMSEYYLKQLQAQQAYYEQQLQEQSQHHQQLLAEQAEGFAQTLAEQNNYYEGQLEQASAYIYHTNNEFGQQAEVLHQKVAELEHKLDDQQSHIQALSQENVHLRQAHLQLQESQNNNNQADEIEQLKGEIYDLKAENNELSYKNMLKQSSLLDAMDNNQKLKTDYFEQQRQHRSQLAQSHLPLANPRKQLTRSREKVTSKAKPKSKGWFFWS